MSNNKKSDSQNSNCSGTSEVLFHKIQWHFTTDGVQISSELAEYLKEEAESKARNDIIAGNLAGELCFYGLDENEEEVEFFGWWSFENE